MFNYKIKFTKKPNVNIADNDALQVIDFYWLALINSGQIIGEFNGFSDNNNFFLTVILPTEESLSDKYNNEVVNENFKKITDIFNVEIIREGIHLESEKTCFCDKPSWYILIQRPFQIESPLICGNCRNPIPLYKIPCIDKEIEHYAIILRQRKPF